MGSEPGLAFALLLVILFASLLFLHSRFRNTSERSETVALVIATALFFFLCGCFLDTHAAANPQAAAICYAAIEDPPSLR
jgi:ABC-type multidrug transport system permease subunit